MNLTLGIDVSEVGLFLAAGVGIVLLIIPVGGLMYMFKR